MINLCRVQEHYSTTSWPRYVAMSSHQRNFIVLWINLCVTFSSLQVLVFNDSNMIIHIIVDCISWDPLEFILNILNVSSLSCVQVKCLRDYQTGSSEQKLLRIWSTRDLLCKCLRQIKGEGTATHRESCKSTICEESWEGQGRKALQHSAVLSKFQSGLQECHSDCSPPEEEDVAQGRTVLTLCLVTGYEKAGLMVLCEDWGRSWSEGVS